MSQAPGRPGRVLPPSASDRYPAPLCRTHWSQPTSPGRIRNVPDAFSPVRTRNGIFSFVVESAAKSFASCSKFLKYSKSYPHAVIPGVGRCVKLAVPRLSYCFRSSSDTFRARASFSKISSEGNRLPSSMSERKGPEMPTFFANSRKDRSALSRNS